MFGEDLDPILTEMLPKVSASVCNAVQYLHQLGFVHGDIKPGNILMRAQVPQFALCDFGGSQEIGKV